MNAVTSNAVNNAINNFIYNIPRAGSGLTDCNTAPAGFYCSNNVANAPTGSVEFIYLLTLSYDNNVNYKLQVCFIINYTTLYIRAKINGTWGSWRAI